MNTYIIEIHPKKVSFDPLAKSLRAELIEAGESPDEAVVNTQRLIRLTGEFTPEQLTLVAETLLIDPVVESATIRNPDVNNKKKPAGKKGSTPSKNLSGWTVDVWPKPGVTDPVGETIQKGLKDLGLRGDYQAASGSRIVFPKVKDSTMLKNLAKQVLANELIHDITLSRIV